MNRDQTLPNQASDKWFQDAAARAIHEEQLERVERFNGRVAMLGIVIGILTEALTGQGIVHQIGLGPLVDGYAACTTRFLPFCF
ncbi:high light inducible protein [Synechococcus sp. WH 8101]|uniref:chlorophyll a/b-binding protein n=1 Tax=Synechococcus sp. WH 8101 TaxID=59932 RepID=UPI00164AF362|nr:chlorophyll a/b-binding protein [Synechococcus sp. WH 8101]QNI45704.1 high light inducible protein [Synechococcus sp. WH 8101]